MLIYATGHEGRGIGLVEKLLAYVEQDNGADTLEANLRLGHAVDSRDYGDAAAVLLALGLHSVRLLTNNPAKVAGLEAAGVPVDMIVPIATHPTPATSGTCRPRSARSGTCDRRVRPSAVTWSKRSTPANCSGR